MILADAILHQSAPLAHLLLADPDAPPPDPERGAVDAVPIIVADAVAELVFAASSVEDFVFRRDLGDLTPRFGDCFVEMGRPSRICAAVEGVNSSAHLPRRWGWRVYAAGRADLAAHLARGADPATPYRDVSGLLVATGLADGAAVARALDAADPYAASRGLGAPEAACLTAAGIAREVEDLGDPDAADRGDGRLGWLMHALLIVDDGDRVGGPIATADLALDRAGRVFLPPLLIVGAVRAASPVAGEYRRLVVPLLFPALLALAFLNCAGVALRPGAPVGPRRGRHTPVNFCTLDIGAVTVPTWN